jgi:hypothetical protein
MPLCRSLLLHVYGSADETAKPLSSLTLPCLTLLQQCWAEAG